MQTQERERETISRMAEERSPSRGRNRALVLVLVLLLLGLLYGALRASAPPTPVLLATAQALPASPRLIDGSWHWLEQPSGPKARLVRASGEGAASAPLATADAIPDYDVADGKTVWVAREGRTWSVYVSTGGDSKRALWSGANRLHSVRLLGGRVYWLADNPAAAPNSGAFPPLTASLRLLSAPADGGTPMPVSMLPESGSGRILGQADNALYVSVSRIVLPGHTVHYRVPLDGGVPRRLAGETALHSALLTQDGTLYWVAPSRESSKLSREVCIRRLGRDGQPETLSEWLPALGTLHETEQGLRYVDGDVQPGLWAVGRRDEVPRAYPLPPGYFAVAAGGREVLLRRAADPLTSLQLYRMPLP